MVNNTIKHAGATIISLKIEIHPEFLNIHFSDNGKGFNLKDKMESKSIGLNSIQSRVSFLGGKVEINSQLGTGTSFTIYIPK
jgi:signal transduction histidine kinase